MNPPKILSNCRIMIMMCETLHFFNCFLQEVFVFPFYQATWWSTLLFLSTVFPCKWCLGHNIFISLSVLAAWLPSQHVPSNYVHDVRHNAIHTIAHNHLRSGVSHEYPFSSENFTKYSSHSVNRAHQEVLKLMVHIF